MTFEGKQLGLAIKRRLTYSQLLPLNEVRKLWMKINLPTQHNGARWCG